jgi:lysozyme
MEQCEAALDEHIVYFLNGLLKLSPSLANENPRRIAAVLSWVYNCGLGNYRISTFKKRIDAKDWSGAQVECRKWNKANGRVLRGLTVRREAEAAMLV